MGARRAPQRHNRQVGQVGTVVEPPQGEERVGVVGGEGHQIAGELGMVFPLLAIAVLADRPEAVRVRLNACRSQATLGLEPVP
ncbi:hypothetical protein ACIBQ1_37700 [Nonomuraea sp. NPDC050153]|uniref:hypothetical protein n=1 Tax=Nonomuraea sp. NPDC050153 TaxID=3364359 RepID=UPI0037A9142F